MNPVLESDNLLFLSLEACISADFGEGFIGQEFTGDCKKDEVGTITAECTAEGWIEIQDNCVLKAINDLVDQSQVTTTDVFTLVSYYDT